MMRCVMRTSTVSWTNSFLHSTCYHQSINHYTYAHLQTVMLTICVSSHFIFKNTKYLLIESTVWSYPFNSLITFWRKLAGIQYLKHLSISLYQLLQHFISPSKLFVPYSLVFGAISNIFTCCKRPHIDMQCKYLIFCIESSADYRIFALQKMKKLIIWWYLHRNRVNNYYIFEWYQSMRARTSWLRNILRIGNSNRSSSKWEWPAKIITPVPLHIFSINTLVVLILLCMYHRTLKRVCVCA